MIKVVHITSSLGGGAGIAAYRLHESLREDGRVDSYLLQKNPPTAEMIEKKIANHSSPLSYRIKKKLSLLMGLSKFERYKKQIRKQPRDYEIVSLPFSYYPLHKNKLVQEADIIHLHWVSDFIDYPSFFTNIKKPIVWTLHDMHPFLGIYHYCGDMKKNTNAALKKIDQEILQLKQNYIYKHGNIYIVTPSEWMGEHSMKSDIFKLSPHYTIANPFDTSSYNNTNNKAACKEILGIDNTKKTLLFIADHITVYRKGIDLLIDALHNIPTESYNIISVGSGDIKKLLPSNVNYKGFGMVNNSILLNQIYSAADITIVPSREDNLPNVVFESMLNGTPVISFTNRGGMAEHIITGENGILVDEITSEALADAINEFINGKYKFEYEIVRLYPIDNFNYKKQSNLYFNLYQSILDKQTGV